MFPDKCGSPDTVEPDAEPFPLDPVADLRRIMARVAWRADPVISLQYDELTDVLIATVMALPAGRERHAHDDLRVELDGLDVNALPTSLRLSRFTGAQRSPAAQRARELLGPAAWRQAIRLTADGSGRADVRLMDDERDGLLALWARLADEVRVVGVQILPDEVRGVVVDETGAVLARSRVPVTVTTPDAVIDGLVQLIERLRAASGPPDWCQAVGVEIGGPVGQDDGVVHDYNKADKWFPEWENVKLRRLIEDAVGLPVTVLNDVVALGVYEQWFGLGSGVGRIGRYGVLLAADGIGGASVVNGAVDPQSPMELGNFVIHQDGQVCRCGKRGCVEATVGEWAIIRRIAEVVGSAVPDIGVAADLAEKGPDASLVRDVFRQAGLDLAAAIGSAQVLQNYGAWVVYFPATLPPESAAAGEFRRGMEEFALWVSYEPDRRCALHVRTVTADVHAQGAALAALECCGLSSAAAAGMADSV